MDDAGESVRVPAYALSGVSFLMSAAALLFLKPLVPDRKTGQTPAAYWADAAVAPKALLFWFVLEGAGVLASVAYFLGGVLVAAAVLTIAIVAFWLNGPRAFEGES